jgi:phosphotransferase system HPr-like phosphotransfer protein
MVAGRIAAADPDALCVFCPVTTEADRRLCDHEELDKAIGNMDVLFKSHPEGASCIVSVYGRDAKKAVARLKKLSKSSGTS